jgi:hypothetical protein
MFQFGSIEHGCADQQRDSLAQGKTKRRNSAKAAGERRPQLGCVPPNCLPDRQVATGLHSAPNGRVR